ncbi:MAG: ferredoxin [Proteobacteria bacterium]|nr:ferredoxin [Pseudomonadota bacterium]
MGSPSRARVARVPDIDLSRCSRCMGCEELCPGVFHFNPAGYMDVAVLDEYPEECVDEAAAKCPEDCISWIDMG